MKLTLDICIQTIAIQAYNMSTHLTFHEVIKHKPIDSEGSCLCFTKKSWKFLWKCKTIGVLIIPSMLHMNAIFPGIWPQIQFDNSDTILQSINNGLNTTLTAELITSDVRIMPSKNIVVWHGESHVMVHLYQHVYIRFNVILRHPHPCINKMRSDF